MPTSASSYHSVSLSWIAVLQFPLSLLSSSSWHVSGPVASVSRIWNPQLEKYYHGTLICARLSWTPSPSSLILPPLVLHHPPSPLLGSRVVLAAVGGTNSRLLNRRISTTIVTGIGPKSLLHGMLVEFIFSMTPWFSSSEIC